MKWGAHKRVVIQQKPSIMACVMLFLATIAPVLTAGQCPHTLYISNGTVNLSRTSIGDKATFTCDNGFELVGAGTLTCIIDGVWNNSLPFCRGRFS